MKAVLYAMLAPALLFQAAAAQEVGPPPKNQSVPFEEYQFYLTEPAIEILDIRHDNDCSPVDGRLSGEGRVVLMKSYRERSRIYMKYMKADGTVTEITRSPCYIDPVVPAL